MTKIDTLKAERLAAFDEKFPTIEGELIGSIEMNGQRGRAYHPTPEQMKSFISETIDKACRATIEECLPDAVFTNYPDTPEGRQSRHENSLWNAARAEMITRALLWGIEMNK